MMTSDQIDAIDAGPECDRLVCQIIAECEIPPLMHPSTDWNDAILAAERFGLWEHDVGGFDVNLSGSKDGTYHVGYVCYDTYERISGGKGPVAICRAILKLARTK